MSCFFTVYFKSLKVTKICLQFLILRTEGVHQVFTVLSLWRYLNFLEAVNRQFPKVVKDWSVNLVSLKKACLRLKQLWWISSSLTLWRRLSWGLLTRSSCKENCLGNLVSSLFREGWRSWYLWLQMVSLLFVETFSVYHILQKFLQV